jgi:hypothetical protein
MAETEVTKVPTQKQHSKRHESASYKTSCRAELHGARGRPTHLPTQGFVDHPPKSPRAGPVDHPTKRSTRHDP